MDYKIFEKIVITVAKTSVQIVKFHEYQSLPIRGERVRVVKQLGAGVYAKVYLVKDEISGFEFAVRVSKKEDVSKTNVSAILATYAMAPVIYYTGDFKSKKEVVSVIVMDYIQDTLWNLRKQLSEREMYTALECLLDKKYLLGFLHGDMHLGNIVLLKDGKTLGFIDFDFSYFKAPPKYNILDFIPLIGSMIKSRDTKLKKVAKQLIVYYKNRFNITIQESQFKDRPKVGGYYYSSFYLNSYTRAELVHFDQVFPMLKLPIVAP